MPCDAADFATAALVSMPAAVRAGRRVELFVQDEDGALRQAAIEAP